MVEEYAPVSLAFFLFGIFCAYWAHTTDRSAWSWFFLALFFAPFAGMALLINNSGATRPV